MKKTLKTSFYLVAMAATVSSCKVSKKAFETYKAPNYSLEENWAALPTKEDGADVVPLKSGLVDRQDSAKVDVFFIHNTTNRITLLKRNVSLKNILTNRRTDISIKYMASVFNGSCKVYAPRYRQTPLIAFANMEKTAKGFDFAYKDVKAAFLYFLDNQSKGRPFILAGHSQGSFHGQRLIKELIETDTALYKRMVTAYLPGWANSMDNKLVVPTDSASQIGSINTWQTTRWGATRNNFLPNKVLFQMGKYSVNPLSWTRDKTLVPHEANKGGAPLFLKNYHPGICDAKIENNLLWIHRPKKSGYVGRLMHFHLCDYSLFYGNIRENVALRIDTYFKQMGAVE